MVNMKRKELSSSPEVQEKEKILRSSDSPVQHASVMLIAEEQVDTGEKSQDEITSSPSMPNTPVSAKNTPLSPKNLDLISKCKQSSPTRRKIDCDYLYSLILGLEMRLFQQEQKMESLKKSHAKEIADLKLDYLELEKQTSEREQQPPQTPVLTTAEKETSCESVNTEIGELRERVAKLEETSDDNRENIVNRELPTLSDDCAKNTRVIGEVNVELGELRARVVELETEREEVSLRDSDGDGSRGTAGGSIGKITEDLNGLRENFKNAKRQAHLEGDKRDQYSRRETLRISGVPYTRGENTNSIMCKIAYSIGVHMSEGDISVSHRNGRVNGNTPRPILVRFARRDVKHQILQNRKNTRYIRSDDYGTPVKIFIDENLTTMRAKVCKHLRERKIDHHTRDGKVFLNVAAADSEANWKVLDSPGDWESLDWPVKLKEELGIYPRD